MSFDSFLTVDWSGGNDRGPTPKKDAIWMGCARDGVCEPPVYLRNRVEAEEAIAELIESALKAGGRLCIGFDFPFGYTRASWDRLQAQSIGHSKGPRLGQRKDHLF